MKKKSKFRPTGPFTVVGFYQDNNQPWVRHERAETAELAAMKSLEKIDAEDLGHTGPRVVSVFRGHRKDQLSNDSLLILADGVVSEVGGA